MVNGDFIVAKYEWLIVYYGQLVFGNNGESVMVNGESWLRIADNGQW